MINYSNNIVKIIIDKNNSAIFTQGKPNNENQHNSLQKKLEANYSKSSDSMEETKATKIKNNVSNNEENSSDNLGLLSIKNENENNNINSEQFELSLDLNINTKSNMNLGFYFFIFINQFIYCQKCKSYIIINFTSNYNYIDISCECILIKNIILDKFIKEYCKDDFLGGINECKKHKKEYIKYCTDCRENLCEDCEKEETKSEKFKGRVHGNHSLKQADYKLFKKNKKKIEEIIEENQNLDIFRIIETYLINFENNPTYYTSIAIKNIVSFIEKYPKLPLNFYDEDIILGEEKMIKIHTLDELNEQIDSESIYSIDIDNKNSDICWNLDFFNDKEFPKLEILNLNGLKINSLEPLCHKVFPNLKLFHLDRNEINNESIDVFNKLKMPKIESISLYENKITSIKIFSVMKKFETLTKLYLGYNKFSADEIDEYIKKNKYGQKIELPPNLILLGLSGNFTKKTNKFIKNINLEKVQILYIYNNELNSLKIFEDIHFTNLKQIWLNNTIISNIEELTNLKRNKNIEVINLTGSYFPKIKNKRFIKSIESFPKLQKLILARCGISTKKICHFKRRINRRRVDKNNKLEIIYKNS